MGSHLTDAYLLVSLEIYEESRDKIEKNIDVMSVTTNRELQTIDHERLQV